MPSVLSVFLVLAFLATPVHLLAQTGPVERARDAAEMLDTASAKLSEAESARDRVRALTQTISAFEEGLSALRSGLRQASQRETALSAKLASQEAEVAELLAVLLRVGATDTPVVLLHPGGPTGTARAGMLVAEVAPALNARAEDLRRDYSELQLLQALQTDAAARLEAGLTEVQAARTALNQAIADRTPLPKRFVADPVREAILLSSAETLESFAAGLDQLSASEMPAATTELNGAKGAMALPVQGRILRGAGEADAAGVTRPGVIVATLPRALVTSPAAATLRYVGALLDLGQVVILEPQADVLFVA